MMRGTWVIALVGCSVLSCSRGSSQGSGGAGPTGHPVIGGMGKRLVAAQAVDLRITPDGRYATYLVDAAKPRVDGVPPKMVLGELHAVPLADGTARKLGTGVTNLPGGHIFSGDGRWVLYLDGYNVANHSGRLFAADLADAATEPTKLGAQVSYMLASPDSKQVAFVDGGVLKVGPLPNGPFRDIAGEVQNVHFAPNGSFVLFKRNLAAAGGLMLLAVDKQEPVKLGEQVGEYAISKDARRIAFAQRSTSTPGTYDLYLAEQPAFKARKLAQGSTSFSFSADGAHLAWTEGHKPGVQPELAVGLADGSKARKIGKRVAEFAFSPASNAIAYLEGYDESARAGHVTVTELPDGKPKRVGTRSPNFAWAEDGKHLAFLSRFVQPIYSVDLMLYPVGGEARKVKDGVFGYGFSGKGARLLLRSGCIREGRACDLYIADPTNVAEAPKKALEGIYSFKSSDDGQRLLVTYARVESDTFDVAVYNLTTQVRKTLEQRIALPAYFVGADGSKVAYIVADRQRAGVYLASDVP